MVISAILVGLLATCGQWWFFGPITKCLVYPLTTGTLVGVFMGEPMTGMIAGAWIIIKSGIYDSKCSMDSSSRQVIGKRKH